LQENKKGRKPRVCKMSRFENNFFFLPWEHFGILESSWQHWLPTAPLFHYWRLCPQPARLSFIFCYVWRISMSIYGKSRCYSRVYVWLENTLDVYVWLENARVYVWLENTLDVYVWLENTLESMYG
jgi:hypothetical protein